MLLDSTNQIIAVNHFGYATVINSNNGIDKNYYLEKRFSKNSKTPTLSCLDKKNNRIIYTFMSNLKSVDIKSGKRAFRKKWKL